MDLSEKLCLRKKKKRREKSYCYLGPQTLFFLIAYSQNKAQEVFAEAGLAHPWSLHSALLCQGWRPLEKPLVFTDCTESQDAPGLLWKAQIAVLHSGEGFSLTQGLSQSALGRTGPLPEGPFHIGPDCPCLQAPSGWVSVV